MILQPEILKRVLWNEAVVKKSYMLRKRRGDRPPFFSERSNASDSRFIELLYRIGYDFSTLWGFVLLLLRPVIRDLPNGRVLLFSNPRQMRGNPDRYPAYSIGIYKRHKGYVAIESTLTFVEIVGAAFASLKARARKAEFKRAWAGAPDLFACTNFGFCRCLDLAVASAALAKVERRSIVYAGHFDPYVMLISLHRESGILGEFIFRQHGLFEAPSGPHRYHKINPDECQLLYRESRLFVEESIVEPRVRLVVAMRSACFTSVGGCLDAIAVATQFDNWDADLEMVGVVKEAAKGHTVIAYPHPATRRRDVLRITSLLGDEALVFLKERHTQIRLLVTRYSSLGMDYLASGIPVIFWDAGVRACVFSDPSVTVVHTKRELYDLIQRMPK